MWSVCGLHVSSSGLPEQFHLGDADLFVGMWSRLETTGLFFCLFPLLFSFLLSFASHTFVFITPSLG